MSKLKMFESFECREIQRFLDDFLSGELSIETSQKILHHLELCSGCQLELESRQHLRSRLKESWNSLQTPLELGGRVKRAVGFTAGFSSSLLRLAAGILLVILGLPGLYLVWRGTPVEFFPYGTSVIDHYQEIVSDHVDCNGKPAQHHRLPLDLQENLIEARLQETAQEFKLVAVQECQSGDAHLIHYIFKGRQGRLSLVLETRHGSESLREREGELRTRLDGVGIRAVREGSLVVAAMESVDHFVYVVGDQFDASQTLEITERLLPSLKNALVGLS